MEGTSPGAEGQGPTYPRCSPFFPTVLTLGRSVPVTATEQLDPECLGLPSPGISLTNGPATLVTPTTPAPPLPSPEFSFAPQARLEHLDDV